MQDTSYSNKLLIIFAGYEQDMDTLLATDPGLDRRLAVRVVFKDLTAAQSVASLDAYMRREGGKDGAFKASPKALELLHSLFDDLLRREQWSNRADIKVVFDMLMNEVDQSFDGAEAAPAQAEGAQPDALMRAAGRAVGGAGRTERLHGTEGDAAAVRLPAKFMSPRRGDLRTCWFKDKSYEAYRTFNSDHVQKVSQHVFICTHQSRWHVS